MVEDEVVVYTRYQARSMNSILEGPQGTQMLEITPFKIRGGKWQTGLVIC